MICCLMCLFALVMGHPFEKILHKHITVMTINLSSMQFPISIDDLNISMRSQIFCDTSHKFVVHYSFNPGWTSNIYGVSLNRTTLLYLRLILASKIPLSNTMRFLVFKLLLVYCMTF